VAAGRAVDPKRAAAASVSGSQGLDDRKVLTAISFVLQKGIPWEYLPQEMGCGSGVTYWRRLREWQEAGTGSGCMSCC
jgi:transposase